MGGGTFSRFLRPMGKKILSDRIFTYDGNGYYENQNVFKIEIRTFKSWSRINPEIFHSDACIDWTWELWIKGKPSHSILKLCFLIYGKHYQFIWCWIQWSNFYCSRRVLLQKWCTQTLKRITSLQELRKWHWRFHPIMNHQDNTVKFLSQVHTFM